MTIKTVGLIGVGLMGHGIGKNILAKGHKLAVLAHRNRAPVDSLFALGATEKSSPAEIAKACDLIIICVTGTPEVEAAIYGENGIASVTKPGLIIADCSTAQPTSTIKIAADLASKNMHFVDTPMNKTPKEAELGKLGLMVGGDAAIIEKIKPILECFAEQIVHTGAVGSAHQVKLINNFLSIGNAALAAEAITVAAKAGIDMQAFKEIIMGGGAASVMFGRLINVPLHDDDSHAKFAIRNARKDLRYYTNMTEQLPVSSFLAATVHQTLVVADNLGYGQRFLPRLIDVNYVLNGVPVKLQSKN
jgi:3-hydroxyisobutyrate dehydrogenase-like beta-hydroxyacid dehydrogenase